MPITKDRSDVPAPAGHAPDPEPRFVTALAEAWFREMWDTSEREFAVEGTRLRASWAGMCTRALAYQLTHTPESNPPGVADAWRMGVGSLVHDGIEPAIRAAFPGAEVEVAVDLRRFGVDGSAHVDIVIHTTRREALGEDSDDPYVISIELKTSNGFGFKMAATAFKGAPEGPKLMHVKQGALGALALDADELVIGYLALECVSVGEAARLKLPDVARFAAEWSFSKAEYTEIAEREMRRMQFVVNLVDEDREKNGTADPTVVPRMLESDEGHALTVVDPRKGRWEKYASDGAGEKVIVDSGTHWACDYCRFRDTCVGDMPS